MTNTASWPAVLRVAHLSGGAVATNNPGSNSVEVCAGLGGPALGALSIPSFGSLIAGLTSAGLSILGVSFYADPKDLAGLRPAEFRCHSSSDGWVLHKARKTWRHIANGASDANDMTVMELSARIAVGLLSSELRLEQLATAYGLQLRLRTIDGKIKDYCRFNDLNSPRIYLAIHALFWELAVLRDALAEFASGHVLGVAPVKSYGRLLSEIRKAKLSDDLSKALLEAGHEQTGWVGVFGLYRNLFTHSSPLEYVSGISFAVQDRQPLAGSGSLPSLYYPLPANVAELADKRSTGPLFASFAELVAASSGRKPQRHNEPDALDYLKKTLEELGKLASDLGQRSPIAPQPFHLTDADLVGEITVVRS